MIALLIAAGIALVVSLVGTPFLISWLRAHGIGQPIREEGPKTHRTKAGTPTMGGLAIVGGAVVGYVVAHVRDGAVFTWGGILTMGAIVGAGTVLDAKKLRETEHIGCAFAVSPGSTQHLLYAAEDTIIPLLPGSATASECMGLMERGYRFQKFFPAEPSGGAAYLAALASPLPQVSFCPTGGVTLESAPRYLKLANVITVGGSWMVTRKLIEAKDWAGIETLARDAARLKT